MVNISQSDLSKFILHEDSDLIVINKPRGISCQKASSNTKETTLEDIIQHHYAYAKTLPRSGIVHRLDKQTTGCLVVGKNQAAVTELQKVFLAKRLLRYYSGLVHNKPPYLQDRLHTYLAMKYPSCKMKVVERCQRKSHQAITYYRVAQKYKHYSLLSFKLETGKTHQIRAHMKHLKCPIVGDKSYSFYKVGLEGQLLHAENICFSYRENHIDLHARLPRDFTETLNFLRRNYDYHIK